MGLPLSYEKNRIQATLTVSLPVDLDSSGMPTSYVDTPVAVTGFTLNFSLNGQPTANFILGEARNARTGAVAASRQLVDQLTQPTPVKLMLNVIEQSQDPVEVLPNWPTGFFKAFDGYTTGLGEQRGVSSASLTLSAVHWLSDMSFSSSISRLTHPNSPAHFAFPMIAKDPTGSGLASWLSPTLPRGVFTSTNMVGTADNPGDFWGLSLSPWLRGLCRQNRVETAISTAITGPTQNIEALRALTRFEGTFAGKNPDGSPEVLPNGDIPYKYGVKSTLDVTGAASNLIAASIVKSLAGASLQSLASMTLWDKLAGEICPQYLLAVIPLVDRALVVPYLPTYRTAWTTLRADEYEAVSLGTELPRPLRAVVMSGFAQTPSGATVLPVPTMGGYYENTNYLGGTVLFKATPPWLAQVTVAPANANQTIPRQNPIGRADLPDKGAALADGSPTAYASLRDASNILKRFAQAYYGYEVTRHRVAQVRSRLRFDIAPGSTVALEGFDDRYALAQLQSQYGDFNYSRSWYATVTQVSIVVDAESQQAYTLFDLGHLRTSLENANDSYSQVNHPLWSTYWRGAPLVDDPAFQHPPPTTKPQT